MVTVCLDVCVFFDAIEDRLHIMDRDKKPSMCTGKSLLDVTGMIGPCGEGFLPRSVQRIDYRTKAVV
jgi:hypothetical protein